MKKLLLVLAVLFMSYVSYTQEDIPKFKGYVSDYENLFTPDQNSHITKILGDYEKQTSIQIFILTVPDFESDVADFAQNTFTEWGVGQKDIDNGLLIIISKNRGLLRTQTGYGLEGYLPDGWLNHTADSIGVKYEGQYYEGMLTYLEQIKERIGSEYSEDNNKELIKEGKNTSDEEQSIIGWMLENIPWYYWVGIVVGWFILLIIWPEGALWLLYFAFTLGKSGGSSGGSGGGSGGGGSTSKW